VNTARCKEPKTSPAGVSVLAWAPCGAARRLTRRPRSRPGPVRGAAAPFIVLPQLRVLGQRHPGRISRTALRLAAQPRHRRTDRDRDSSSWPRPAGPGTSLHRQRPKDVAPLIRSPRNQQGRARHGQLDCCNRTSSIRRCRWPDRYAFAALVADGTRGPAGSETHWAWRVERARSLAAGCLGASATRCFSTHYSYLRPRTDLPARSPRRRSGGAGGDLLTYLAGRTQARDGRLLPAAERQLALG